MNKWIALEGAVFFCLAGCADERGISPAPTLSTSSTIVAKAPAHSRPNLDLCERPPPLQTHERVRTGPLAFPSRLADVVASDVERIAVATLRSGTVCVDTSWMEEVSDAKLSPDGRFLEFGWVGNELFGHVVVDRAGTVPAIDTGVAPVPSPSGRRIAALDYSDSGYGALNAFAVWNIAPSRLTEAARIEELPNGADWRIDRWAGEDCLELSAIDWAEVTEAVAERAAPRKAYVAQPVGGSWQIRPAAEGGCQA